MEDFLHEMGPAGAPSAEESDSARQRLLITARRMAKGITAAVLPKKGFVKGVAERWTEAHLNRSPEYSKPYTGFTPVTPASPELKLSNLPEWTPDRVGPLSFERRRTLIEQKINEL